ncbi:MAG: triphosphoribosyl-dephospho-CoA synthase [Methanosarcinaceae archaeon]|nr:triphosphoribosyl-dephospho-CoA synthase [Methanosarcinaceae archaeon]
MNVRLKRSLVSGYTSNSYTVASYIARCVQLAMVMEVSAHPKPGNVDRTHDYEDTRFEHFLASAVSIYPVMENAANSKDNKVFPGVGSLIHSAVRESANWQNGGNAHFGAFILLVPLAIAAGNIFQNEHEFTIDELVSCAHDIVKRTNTQDAIEFYKSFETAKVRVNPVDEFDLQDIGSIDSLDDDNITLYDLMEISKGYDMIADEWVNGFKRCANCGETIIQCMGWTDNSGKSKLDVNDVVVYAFIKTLSENRDTFIQTKFDEKTADYVSGRARDILLKFKPQETGFDAVRLAVEEFDDELLSKGINPGSTADIVIAGLFIALLGGVRF